jgi:hypothetical protein
MNRKLYALACLIAFVSLIFTFQVALAHESITIGDYTIEVGWLSEPPIVGQQNGIVVNVSMSDEQPVEDVSSLTVTISYGGQSKSLTLQPLGEDTPGQFVAPILPTVAGEYTVTFGGTLGETAADAETHVEEVQPEDTLQFPSLTAESSASAGMMSWLVYLSLVLAVIALAVGIMALRKAG